MESTLVTTRDFDVCGTCCELRGPFEWRLQGVIDQHVQECVCARGSRDESERPERWRGFDFNTVAELCYVCGCDVLRSGSRYSVWLCAVCKLRVLELCAELGRLVVPIGRHSIMNGFVLPTTPEPTDLDTEAFADRLLHMGTRINRLHDWARAVVRSNLAVIGREDADALLSEYLAAVGSLDRHERFDAMVASMTAPA